ATRRRVSSLQLNQISSKSYPNSELATRVPHDEGEPRLPHPCSVDRFGLSRSRCIRTASPADRRPDCQELWSRVMGSSRGDPLHVQHGLACAKAEVLPLLGLGAEEGPDLVRRAGQGRQPPQGHLLALSACWPECGREGRSRSRVL